MLSVDPDRVAGFIREVAAERIVPRFRSLQDHEISTKTGPTDLVTVADVEAEEDLSRILQGFLPGSLVVGEEAVSAGGAFVDTLRERTDVPVWVIDPVDGTHNFAHGKPVFGSMVALVYGGESVGAWILDVPGDRMAVAEKGSGASLDGVRIALQTPDTDMSAMRCFVSRKFLPPEMRAHFKSRMHMVGKADPLFCCAHEYIALLAGEAVFSVYSRIKPWDHLPGALLVQEAGGYVCKWDGSVYMPGEEDGGLICAPDEALWDAVRGVFF